MKAVPYGEIEAAKALKNGTFTPGNALYNRISEYCVGVWCIGM